MNIPRKLFHTGDPTHLKGSQVDCKGQAGRQGLAEERRGLCSESKRRRVKPDGFDAILSIPDLIYAPGVDDDAETAFDSRSGALTSWR
jgi:hypothetical protein